jgi:hypothetical protein
LEHDRLLRPRYALFMLSEWLRAALDKSGVGQAELARHLTKALGRSVDRAAVNKMTMGKRKITADEMVEIARYLDAPQPMQNVGLRTVRVAGHVEAGYWAEQWEWADDDRYDVAVPADPLLDGFTLYAAETRGRSMDKKYPEGTIVVFTNVIETEESPQPGKRYVVERIRSDGKKEHTVKLLHQDEKGKYWLVPESSDPLWQEPISVEDGAQNGDEVRIVGRVRYAVTRE